MAQFTFNGKPYEAVAALDFTVDETLVLYGYAKLTLDQLGDIEGYHPGLVPALVHVAVARAEPGETDKTIREMIGQTNAVELLRIFSEITEEVEEVPPPSAAAESSPSGGSGETSGTIGEMFPAPTPANGSGSLGLDTGQASDRVTSVG